MTQYLAAHPDLFMARKEMHFFGSDLHFGPQFYRRDEPAYLREFQGWSGQSVIGESSVWYLFSARAAAEIKAFSPEAKILILLREPAEMLHSLYGHFRFDGNECLSPFATALAAEEDRRAGRRLGRQAYFPQGLAYRLTVRYAEQVRRYFEAFGRERVHVVLFDDLRADSTAVCRGTLAFLGLNPDRQRTPFAVVNSARRVRHPAVQAILGEPLLRSAVLALRPWLPTRWFAALRGVEARLHRFNARVAPHPPLDPSIRRQLRLELAAETSALGQLLERDLAAWREPAPRAEAPSVLPVWLRDAVTGNSVMRPHPPLP